MKNARVIFYFLFGISLVVSISGAYIIGSLLLIDWMVRKERPWTKSPLDVPLGLYFVWGLITVLVTGSTGFLKSITTQCAFVLFFLMAHRHETNQVKMMIIGFCVASGVMGFWAVLQTFSGIDFDHTKRIYDIPAQYTGWPEWLIHEMSARNGRPTATRSHPLTFAEGLIPAFFILTAFLLSALEHFKNKRREIFICIVLLLGVILGLVTSQARAVWLGIGMGVILMSFYCPPKIRIRFLISIVVAGVLLISVSPTIRYRVLSIFKSHTGSIGDRESRSERFSIWESALNKFKENPVLGVGVRGIRLEIDHRTLGPERVWTETHNIFLQSALERGLIGISILVWILILVGFIFWNLPPPWKGPFLGILIAFIISGLTESWMKDKEVAMIFWTFVGVGERLRQNRNEKWE